MQGDLSIVLPQYLPGVHLYQYFEFAAGIEVKLNNMYHYLLNYKAVGYMTRI